MLDIKSDQICCERYTMMRANLTFQELLVVGPCKLYIMGKVRKSYMLVLTVYSSRKTVNEPKQFYKMIIMKTVSMVQKAARV